MEAIKFTLKELCVIEETIEKELAAAKEEYAHYTEKEDIEMLKIYDKQIEIYKNILEKLK